MKKIAFFDTKPYAKESFDRLNNGRYEIMYFETRLTAAALRDGTVGGAWLDVYEERSSRATWTRSPTPRSRARRFVPRSNGADSPHVS